LRELFLGFNDALLLQMLQYLIIREWEYWKWLSRSIWIISRTVYARFLNRESDGGWRYRWMF